MLDSKVARVIPVDNNVPMMEAYNKWKPLFLKASTKYDPSVDASKIWKIWVEVVLEKGYVFKKVENNE